MTPDPRQAAVEHAVKVKALALLAREIGDIGFCQALDLLAEGTGQNKYQHAASILRGAVLGRKAINDNHALRRIAAFPMARRHEAVGIVAGQLAGAGASEKEIDTIAHRLRRKLRAKETDKMAVSVSSIP